MHLHQRPTVTFEKVAKEDEIQREKSILEDHAGFTALHKACDHGELSAVKDLVHSWSDIYKKDDKHGFTPLHVACIKGHRDVAAFLINPQIKFGDDLGCEYVSEEERKSYVNKRCKRGRTALHYACMGQDRQLVIDLLQLGADVKLKDLDKCTALHMACKYDRLLTVKTLILFGADIFKRSKNGQTPLHIACSLGHRDLAVLLIKLEKMDLKYIEDDGAPTSGSKVLIVDNAQDECGFWRQAPCEKDRYPLHYACQTSDTRLVKDLLLSGVNVDNADYGGYTSLHVACEHGQLSTVEELINSGADIRKRTKKGRTALHIVCKFGYGDIATFLINEDGRIRRDIKDIFADEQVAVDVKSFVDEKCLKNRTPLHYACRGSNTQLVKDLLKSGADLHLEDTNGFTALHVACKYGVLSTVQELLRSGSDIHNKNKSGLTALHIARKFGHGDVSAFLDESKKKVEEKREE